MTQRPRPFRAEGQRVRDAREDHGLRQSDLADAIRANGYPLSVRQPDISEIERGYVGIPDAMREPLRRALPGLTIDATPTLERLA